MLRVLLLFSLIINLTSCSDDPLKFRKSKTIPSKDLVSILVEMHIMDAMTNHYKLYNKYSPKDTVEIYTQIFEKYGYTKAEFDTTIVNYTKRPDLYERVYNEVLMKLNYILDTIQNKEPKFEEDRLEIMKGREIMPN